MKENSLLIVGTGYVGFSVGKYFIEKGFCVYGLCRDRKKKEKFEKESIIPLFLDITKKSGLKNLPSVNYVLVSVAPDQREPEDYEELYVKGIGNVLDFLKNQPSLKKLIYVSSTGVWKDKKGEVVKEDDSPDADTPRGKILIEAEKQILDSQLPSLILRLSGIYGPGRNRLHYIDRGTWPKGGSSRMMNMIHLTDITRAIAFLFNQGKIGEVYVGTDDEPVLNSQFCDWLSKEGISIPSIEWNVNSITGKQCQNKKLISLGFEFQYPTFREGYRSLLKSKSQETISKTQTNHKFQ